MTSPIGSRVPAGRARRELAELSDPVLAGVFALLLSLLVWGPLNRRRSRSGGHA